MWPFRGGDAEVASLMLQGDKYVSGLEPTEDECERVLQKIVEEYPKTKTPPRFRKTTHSITELEVRRMFYYLNRQGSPGLPWASLAASKGELCDQHGSLVVRAVLERLSLLETLDCTGLAEDPRYLVANGYCDPVRIFVKNEPHTKEKALDKRWRLISSVSIVDEIIERLLCHTQNEEEIDNWLTCPSKPGIGLSLDEQASSLFESVRPHLKDAAEADVSGWDWCVKWFMFKLEVRARIRLCGAKPDSAFAKILYARVWCLARSVFSTSDGRLFMQTVPGVMKSGSYLTSSTNSRMRVMLAYLIGATWAVAMGDDSLETWTDGAIESYALYGIKVKMFRRCGTSFEFCSHRFINGVAIPLNWAKGLFRLLSARPEMERVMQFSDEFRHSPHLVRCVSTIYREWKELGKVSFENA